MHTHKCGYTALGQLKDYGCGYIWEHETTDNWYMVDHYCPKCGCGPFTFIYNGNNKMVTDHEKAD